MILKFDNKSFKICNINETFDLCYTSKMIAKISFYTLLKRYIHLIEFKDKTEDDFVFIYFFPSPKEPSFAKILKFYNFNKETFVTIQG